ncbi:mannose-P-dolichol utilization defect 1 protein [Anaeromyces robustus]|uniref:Mannose-P-dolichol utilization defect 1 protein homolog n=1 Tax=Anaeromyces robustus TaxID=1754192 RepID=A0A1Y1VSY4_9FUNG|nr:mannose-P-dolichol utilization defect 1 protein [Anaeromyces robustus]|eukprot:ORX63864.1 mannose-P-dolichol utilization defect 1 protein [Anaeromyces robustus]
MAELINYAKNFIISLIGDKCYVELVENLNVKDIDCLKYSFSKVLGLGMVCGGAILKVPQIIKILMSKSTKGISVTSYFMDLIALFINISYNVRFGYPFTTWGEYPFMDIIPNSLLQLLQTSTIGINIASRVPQIFTNYKNGNTGELSFLTVFFQCAGSLARVFTTIQEVNDPVVFAGNFIASSLNTVLFLQILYYWRSTSSGYVPLKSKKSKPRKKRI